MSCIDTQSLNAWIGTTREAVDVITPRLVHAYRATLAPCLSEPDVVAPGLHWCLAPPVDAMEDLGDDGHPRTGGFLPPVPLPRRMWAGGTIEFLQPLQMGETVTRVSTISDIQVK
jgi:3-methylfumaryl-CoA hydratase